MAATTLLPLSRVRIGQRRVRVRRSALEEFIAARRDVPLQPDNESVPVEPDANPDAWARLGAALADSSATFSSEDGATLSQGLSSLAEAARSLAERYATRRDRFDVPSRLIGGLDCGFQAGIRLG